MLQYRAPFASICVSPPPEMAERFKGDENVAEKFAYQQATLQGAYFILAVGAIGLDRAAGRFR